MRLLLAAAVLLLAAGLPARSAQADPTSLVDPFIGVDGDGNTVPGPKVPFGFANPSPHTIPETEFRFDTSGYRSGRPVIGFSQTHVSGTGGEGKYGNFRITPSVGDLSPGNGASAVSDERAEPGYYGARLTKHGIEAELTATRMVAVHRYRFPATDRATVSIDTGSVIFTGGGSGRRQRPIASRTRIVGDRTVVGSVTVIGGWNPSPYTLHYVAQFSRPFRAFRTWRDSTLREERTISGEQAPSGALLQFDVRRDRSVEVKVGLSFVSTERAAEHIREETGSDGFDVLRNRARASWSAALGRIAIEGGSDRQRRTFASALYRSHFMPQELTGDGPDVPGNGPRYEDFYAIWDTFRTVHPLLTLIQPERQRDMLRSLLAIYSTTGWLPDSRVAGANGMMQGSTSGDMLFADAWAKQLGGIDYPAALNAVAKNADVGSPRPSYEGKELGDYLRLGYLSTDYERSASRTLEYAATDFAAATLAAGQCRVADARRWLDRSRNWENLWDRTTSSIRPRGPDGRWMAPFDKSRLYMFESPRFTWMSAPYYEGSAYQYSTYVPHDVPRLIARVGGDAAFVDWLDVLFRARRATGLLDEGLYSHVNEPDMLASWLYIYAGRPDRTQERVRDILERDYKTGRSGLPGNDDAGTMSAWYVWGALGLYPNAGQDLYLLSAPLFERSRIELGGGRSFVIEASGASASRKFIAGATLNGRPLERAWLRHPEIARGGILRFQLSERPTQWGRTARPPNARKELAARIAACRG